MYDYRHEDWTLKSWKIQVKGNAIQVVRAINGETRCPQLISMLVWKILKRRRIFTGEILHIVIGKARNYQSLAQSTHNFEEEMHWTTMFLPKMVQLALGMVLSNCLFVNITSLKEKRKRIEKDDPWNLIVIGPMVGKLVSNYWFRSQFHHFPLNLEIFQMTVVISESPRLCNQFITVFH